ncbi:MAG: type I secretion system permease/ATPase [Rhodobacterales bacterium]|nr:type I secretion system permease/ATPase [Rhodobacterales bacterium]
MRAERPQPTDRGTGQAELAAALRGARLALGFAFIFSALVNILMLTSPLYMLQVYDRVLASRSEETLVALSLLAAFLFLVMGVLDHSRGRIMARVGASLQAGLEARVHAAALRRLAVAPNDLAAQSAVRDLDALARLWASPALVAMFDAPWTPLFLAALFVFHPLLGWVALAGGGVLIGVTLLNQRRTEAPLAAAHLSIMTAEREAYAQRRSVETIAARGMAGPALSRWQGLRARGQREGLAAADIAGRWSTVTRTFRLVLQSAMLGLAAWLVLRHQVSGGAMVAASVLMGRALQPVEQAIGHWSVVTAARQARARLAVLLSETPEPAPRTRIPRPRAVLEVTGLSVVPPGGTAPVLRGVSFTLQPGQVMGVIGPSGSGKTTLARALVGAWAAAAGQVRLDGATLDQYDRAALGRWIGYLPQQIDLFDGTVAENIARLDACAPPDQLITAARSAAVHEMILRLPLGYDSPVSAQGAQLSGGQVQRIGLARALFGDPVLLILDEPNASLDSDGMAALNDAVRAAKAAGSVVLLMAHRPAALQECDLLLVLRDGAVAALGPRDAVLRDQVRNAAEIGRTFGLGATA